MPHWHRHLRQSLWRVELMHWRTCSCRCCITWWRHQMETFSALLALCTRNSPVPVNSPHKDQWRRALMFYLITAWINDWVNNREADDLRCHRGHYDVNVMSLNFWVLSLHWALTIIGPFVVYIRSLCVKLQNLSWYKTGFVSRQVL